MRKGKAYNCAAFAILHDQTTISRAPPRKLILGPFRSCHSNHEFSFSFSTRTENKVCADAPSYVSLLRSCGNAKSLADGMLVHANIVRDGHASHGSSLLQMYSECGASEDALALFDKMHCRDAFAWTYIIRAHSHSKDSALRYFQQMQQEGVLPNKFISIGILSALSGEVSLMDSRRMHTLIFASGLEYDVYVATAIISMYSNCSSITDALVTFEKMSNRDAVAWNAMLAAYVNAGCGKDALKIFEQMQRTNIAPTKATFLSVLEACANLASLEEGKLMHGFILARRLHEDIAVGNAIINMYSKCGSVGDARDFFDQMPEHNTISWNTMIAAYTQTGQEEDVLLLFDQMQEERISMDKVTFVSLLSACASPATLSVGKQLHHHLMCSGFDLDAVVGTALVNMYGKCSSLDEAHNVFNNMPELDIISWNAMISAYGQHGFCDVALQVFALMQLNHIKPDKVTFVSILDACASQENLDGGWWMHDLIRESDFENDVMVGTALVRMYGNCGCLEEAEKVFDKILDRDIILWNNMVALYVQHGKSIYALVLYDQMLKEGVMPNKVTCSSLLNACASQYTVAVGKQMHARFAGSSFGFDLVIETALINMYGKCGCLESAHHLFDRMHARDLIAWTTMISLYAQHEQPQEAFQLFSQMQQEGLIPDIVTIIGMISACASQDALYISRQIHACIVGTQFDSDTVLGNALVNMYGKCGRLEDAVISFAQMHKRDTVSFLNILSACSSQAALIEGQQVHSLLVASGLEFDSVLSNALVNIYGKCGFLKDARKLFDQMTERNVVSWNAMIAAYSQNGNGIDVLRLFDQMQQSKVKPDNFTFVSILTGCSHAGLVDEGCRIFLAMGQSHEVSPILDHYNCMLDILARAGQLDEAESLIKVMPLQATAVSWTILLGACKTEVDVGRGERAAANALKLDPEDVMLHVLLSNVYSAAGRMEVVDMVRSFDTESSYL